jgi:hypothetical protein
VIPGRGFPPDLLAACLVLAAAVLQTNSPFRTARSRGRRRPPPSTGPTPAAC